MAYVGFHPARYFRTRTRSTVLGLSAAHNASAPAEGQTPRSPVARPCPSPVVFCPGHRSTVGPDALATVERRSAKLPENAPCPQIATTAATVLPLTSHPTTSTTLPSPGLRPCHIRPVPPMPTVGQTCPHRHPSRLVRSGAQARRDTREHPTSAWPFVGRPHENIIGASSLPVTGDVMTC